MKPEFIKPIPKYILDKIRKMDLRVWPEQKGPARMYSYLTTIKKELVKITVAVKTAVAVKNHKKQWYYKQVAAHGVKSGRCWVKDIEYKYFGYGYRVGWHAEGLYRFPKWYEDGRWYDADFKYYNPYTKTVNIKYASKFPEYRYSAYQLLDGRCIIGYLKLYEKYPQTEYLLKLGLIRIHDSLTVLKRVGKDKHFRMWLIANKAELAENHFYIGTIMQAYKTGKTLKQIQMLAEYKKRLERESRLLPIKELFDDKDLERFFTYLESQNSKGPFQADTNTYLDYLKACNYLGLDMLRDKNRFPRDFKRWHDIRIDEYNSARALADEKARAELYEQFAAVARKYISLQNCKKGGYAVFIAKSPAELMREGEQLHHCVGKMNYDRKMAREETLIFFIREVETLDIPFVTVEYSPKSKKVLQCYGDNSTAPAADVIHYVRKVWLPYANRTIKKISGITA